MAITNLGAFRYIGLDADIPQLGGILDIEPGAIFDAFDTQRKFVFSGSAWVEFSGISDNSEIFVGQSTDTKPTSDITLGARFLTNDTGRNFIWDDKVWNYENRAEESENFHALESRSSFVQLFGDTFAVKAADSVYLLEDLDDSQGGTPLTNNGTIGFAEDPDLPLRGFLVPTLDGTTQYFSLPTEGKVEVGLGSFVASIWFKTAVDSAAINQTFFSYGDDTTLEQAWLIEFNSSGQIRTKIRDVDGDQAIHLDSRAFVYNDNKWHIATMMVDRITQQLTLTVDGESIINSAGNNFSDTSAVGDLDNAGTNLQIGSKNPIAQNFFDGQLTNFSLYFPDTTGTLPPDYNIPGIVNAGIRESATLGTSNVTFDSTLRINNKFIIPSVVGNYSTSVINTSTGYYEIITIEGTGTPKISIDGNEITNTTNIFLSAGSHIIKYENTLSSLLQFATLELVKRDGENQGDDEASSLLLTQDELLQRQSGEFSFLLDTSRRYNQTLTATGGVTGSFYEGDIFLKKGLYNVTVLYSQDVTRANITMNVGGVEVLFNFVASGSLANSSSVTRSVFLDGGKTIVRLELGDTSAGTSWDIAAIRFELVTGKTNGDVVSIQNADQDAQILSGTGTLNLGEVLTGSRFNCFSRSISTDDNSFQYRRYFSGGTYRVKWGYRIDGDGALASLGINTPSNVISNLSQNGGTTNNNVVYATVTISRGFHNIIFSGEDGGSSDFRVNFQRLQFTKIGAVLNAKSDDNSDPVHGSLVPLGIFNLPTDGDTMEIETSIPIEVYSELQLVVQGRLLLGSEIRLTLNDLTSPYYQDGYASIGGSLTAIDISNTLAHLLIASASLGLVGRFSSRISIVRSRSKPTGNINTCFDTNGQEQTSLYLDTFEQAHKFTITLDGSGLLQSNSGFTIYGVKI